MIYLSLGKGPKEIGNTFTIHQREGGRARGTRKLNPDVKLNSLNPSL